MAKKMSFMVTVIYDEDENYAGNVLDAIEHEIFNIEGLHEWSVYGISDADDVIITEEETE